MKTRTSVRLLLASALVVSSVLYISAQTFSGGLRGLVQDPGGANVPAATVTATNEASGVVQRTTTNGAGEYSFPQLNPATYTVAVEAQGFKKVEEKGIVVAAQQTIDLDLHLQIGAVSESVVITAEAPVIETADAQQGQDINNQQINDLPDRKSVV